MTVTHVSSKNHPFLFCNSIYFDKSRYSVLERAKNNFIFFNLLKVFVHSASKKSHHKVLILARAFISFHSFFVTYRLSPRVSFFFFVGSSPMLYGLRPLSIFSRYGQYKPIYGVGFAHLFLH